MAKDKYEISIWEDYLVSESGDVPAHYEEKKIAIIGSNSITATCRAYEPKLVENINGSNTFTFKMFYTFKENNVQDLVHQFATNTDDDLLESSRLYLVWKEIAFDGTSYTNPFLSLLVNERKIKVYWKNKWYDFIIKSCQEDSSGKSITYTCKDLYINELSKTGFDLEFDTELENNQGTVTELAAKVLENTDWQLDVSGSDTIQQEKDEPVYETYTTYAFSATNETQGTTVTIPLNSHILVFYTPALNQNKYCQFLYDPDDKYPRDTNSQLVVDVDCYSVNLSSWSTSGTNQIAVLNGHNLFTVVPSGGISSDYRGSRLVKSQKSVLDSLTGKYCSVFKANRDGTGDFSGLISEDDIIYRYQATEYRDPTVVNNLIVNSKDFSTTEGWLEANGDLTFQLYPPYTSATDLSTYEAKSYLRIKSGNVYNTGARESSSYIPNGFQYGDQYILRIRAMSDSSNTPSGTYISTGITPRVCRYTDGTDAKVPVANSDYFTVSGPVVSNFWMEYTLTCKKSITRADIYTDKLGIFLVSTGTYWLEEVQFYPYVEGMNVQGLTQRIDPGEMDIQSVAQVYYYYFNHTKNDGLLSSDDLNYLYVGAEEWDYSGIDAQYNENFEKIRSISAKNSNRFNLLQSLAETFECWCKFDIQHDAVGRTVYVDGVPQKFVSFVSEVGQETGIGFIYGIDLKTISRTIQSDQIVTKTIVSANNNEYATNGFCTIARSAENYARDTFILNFDYYINQGLIDGNELNKDLYLSTDSMGYFYNLHTLNMEYDDLTDLLTEKNDELLKQEAYQTTYENYITSLQEQIQELRSEILQLSGTTSWAAAKKYVQANPNNTEVVTRMNTWQTTRTNCVTYQSMLDKLDDSVAQLQDVIEEKEERQEEIRDALKALHLQFYKKYSRYIQEGSWTSEEYVDDDLYFLDAQSVAYTSSRPQISYNISVIRISSLEEFENKIFRLGDISFIQDTEFFGYTYVNGIKTPYKEKVLVSEITSNFDSPEQDTFKVQNYKTQFEDLFQRITSTTQSLQYASGEYARAASVVETDGTINVETLQNSISMNSQLVYEAQNESIIQDCTGITVTDATDPSKKTKLTSGGIFITTDGGATWKNAVRGEGIATQYLTAGSINAANITILDGSFQAFRWDSQGINAFYQMPNDAGINLSKFVRFDHFGIYGIDNDSGTSYTPDDEDDIWDDAKFGLTWRGFFIKNKYNNHYVEVSSENDIQVIDTSGTNDVVRVKIGLLSGDGSGTNDVYGIKIANASGASVLETIADGTLWLKKELNISATSGTNYEIALGYLDGVKAPGSSIRQIFNANDKFIVCEDGSMQATDGTFTGTIYATGGQIGNMTIEQVENSVYKVIIDSDSGTIFKNGTGTKVLTARLYEGDTEVTTGTFGYVWFKNDVQQSQTTKSISVTADSTDAVYTYTCRVTYTPAQS